MNQSAIFAPMFAMFFLTIIVWVYMYVKRIRFIRRNELTTDERSPIEFTRLSPPEVSNPSDNLKNLFEIPLLFYVVLINLFAVAQVDSLHLVAAWVFVVFRVMHSLVHCTVNIVMLRFNLYLVATLSLWVMIVRSAYQYFFADIILGRSPSK